MNKKIGSKEAEEACRLAIRVWKGEMSVSEAVIILSEDLDMNQISAGNMIRSFSSMMEGHFYKRTINITITRIYFENIRNNFGKKYLKRAIDSTIGHINYYESLPKGGNCPSLRKLCEEFEILLSMEIDPL